MKRLPLNAVELSWRAPSRRFVVAALLLPLAGCAGSGFDRTGPTAGSASMVDAVAMYGPVTNEPFPIDGLNVEVRDPELSRQEVRFADSYASGTVVVNIAERRLYLVQPGGRAMRYAIGVGREEALDFHGSAVIGRKAEWPTWTPTANMVRHIPGYAQYASGMPGGADNPLGARALYLYRNGKDTDFRLHGTTEPESIGTAVSSGCIRLVDQDIIDLYDRVPTGAPVVVLQTWPAGRNAGL